MIRPVDIIIHQDWDDIRKLYNIASTILANSPKKTLSLNENYYPGLTYDFGDRGQFSLDTDGALSKDWGFLLGDIINSKFPWHQQADEIFSALDLEAINFSIHYTSIARHIDGKDNQQLKRCNLNYIIACEDPNAVTISLDANDPDKSYSYPSIPTTAWLLDPDLPHEIHCEGQREILQFRFNKSYQTVSDFLDNYGPIILG